MTADQAMEVARRIRAAWPDAYLDDERVSYWAEFLEQFGLEDAIRALDVLQRKDLKAPSFGRFTDVLNGEASQKHKCPKCGLGFKTEARVIEHINNVHW